MKRNLYERLNNLRGECDTCQFGRYPGLPHSCHEHWHLKAIGRADFDLNSFSQEEGVMLDEASARIVANIEKAFPRFRGQP